MLYMDWEKEQKASPSAVFIKGREVRRILEGQVIKSKVCGGVRQNGFVKTIFGKVMWDGLGVN